MRFMTFPLLTVGCLLVLTGCNSNEGPQTDTTPSPAAASTAEPASKPPAAVMPAVDETSGTALSCDAGEELLFGCSVTKTGKSVALCITADTASQTRYRFGTSSNIELDQVSSPDTRFARTSLVFAGGTGGYAYSFHRSSNMYALYSISGDNGLARSGIAVLDAGGKKIADMTCDPESFKETQSMSTIRATRTWPSDPVVAKTSF